jgi:hypothetical protein
MNTGQRVILLGLTVTLGMVFLTSLWGVAMNAYAAKLHDSGRVSSDTSVSLSTLLFVPPASTLTATSVLSHSVFLPLVAVSRPYGAVIIDGPWTNLPPGAGVGLALDKEWAALTLQSNMTSLAFVLQPDPDKTACPNGVWDLGTCNGRLYLGYGDLVNNRGPVDIVSYDPLSGILHREMLDIPEEQVGGWYITDAGNV